MRTNWLSPATVTQAIEQATGLHALGLISEQMRDHAIAMARFYHCEFQRREREGVKVRAV